ncbi:aspartyl/glutamyl-tRNA(Asn/Gln) amidotransferase subunit C [Tsuneonella deserti]|uniref:Aspartyl/glutamyl-tRNA(Asn/Gln) amidotransferase subunit C n=2 Tax=Tsuneonella deserti TaxID=2035528 RepID=A0ABQ1S8X2_9SPHN|nr:aspartyl/glutamyl-tRNA(Asn/Gln) amidotransferase subunit C [Tsuneonella deserti]
MHRSIKPATRLKGARRAANARTMSVTRETVAKIASLARIRMDEPELDRMVPELNAILDWVEQLGEVDTSGVEPMTAVIANTLRLRDDVVDADPLTGGGIREKVLANAPAAEHGFFGVPKVIE